MEIAMSARPRRRLRRLRPRPVDKRLSRATGFLERRSGLCLLAAAALSGAGGYLVLGPVAAAVACVYGAIGASAWLGLRRRRLVASRRAVVVDTIAVLAADLRAGLPAQAAVAEAMPVLRQSTAPPDRPTARTLTLVSAAWQLSERLGAPLSDLLDRVESDLRSAERVRLSVAAQVAGAQVTTWLLAALPLAGIGLGYGMGVDPARILLRTPLGAGCTLLALSFQCAGLGWSSWLTRAAAEEAGA
jgi:tight adherence protein B